MFNKCLFKIIASLATMGLLSCQSSRVVNSVTPGPSPSGGLNLTLAQATLRASQIHGISYRLSLDLTQPNAFSGVEEIRFVWGGSDQNLRLDFYQGEITALEVNGQAGSFTYDGQVIQLAYTNLKVGSNQIQIRYSHPYTDTGGLARFVDPEDQRVYLHSKFEPYFANRMFPCFDQPDLKATYTLTVKAPKDWTVIGPTAEIKKEPEPQETVRWSFSETAPFSTYLFSVHAGPFKMWSDKAGEIPLRLFARQSLARYVDAPEWFTWTKQGFAFYLRYTAYPYPFKKYDQIIAPAFLSGAMENVAAVTFSERLVPRGKKLRENRRRNASIILHEMAHMWFGDLVTMKWWNDLWLNESFATFAAEMASVEATEFKEAAAVSSGYRKFTIALDELVTTHPIESRIGDTKDAETSFDGLTYDKGAAVLRQLQYYLGNNAFKKGIQSYFKTYAWKNTERKDFIQSLATASGRDLSDWQEKWLTTANVNTIQVDYACDAGKITKFDLLQSASPGFPTIRPHAFEVAFLDEKGGRLSVTRRLRAETSGKLTSLVAAKGLGCPLIVFPNDNGVGYFKVGLDKASAERLLAGASKIPDQSLQILVWSALWQAVQDSRLSFIRYGDAVARALDTEKRSDILETHFYSLSDVSDLYYSGGLQNTEAFGNFVRKVEASTWSRFSNAKPESKKFWFEPLVALSQTSDRLALLAGILNGQVKTPGFQLDSDLRWEVLRHLAGYGFKDIQGLIAKEQKADASFNGKIGAITSEAAQPEWSVKSKWIEEYKKEKPAYSYVELRSVVQWLFPPQQENLRKRYQKQFFEDLIAIRSRKDSMEQATFARLAPFSCEDQSLTLADGFLKNHPDLDALVVKRLREAADLSTRCYKIIHATF